MGDYWDPEAEFERLERTRERIRQLRAKVKYLQDDVSGSRCAAESGDAKKTPRGAEKPTAPARNRA